MTGLQPNTSYAVNVAVCTIAGEGPMSDEIIISTLNGISEPEPEPERVGPITTISRSFNSITFSWHTEQHGSGSGIGISVESGDYVVSLSITILI